jgi:hypothetical protein
MVLTPAAAFTAIVVGVGSTVLGSYLTERGDRARNSTTPEVVRLLQCLPTPSTPLTGPGSAMSVFCENAYAASVRNASWEVLFQAAGR